MNDRQRMEELHGLFYLRNKMFPAERKSDYPSPRIMDNLELFRRGFYSSDRNFYNLTKSTLTKILSQFIKYPYTADFIFLLGNIRFLTKIFDIENVKRQIQAYLKSPYVEESKGLVHALDELPKHFQITEAEKRFISEVKNITLMKESL